jgi:hypothetical protein
MRIRRTNDVKKSNAPSTMHDALSLHSHCTRIALSLHSHCTLIALSLHSHCTLIALSLHSHCTRIALTGWSRVGVVHDLRGGEEEGTVITPPSIAYRVYSMQGV